MTALIELEVNVFFGVVRWRGTCRVLSAVGAFRLARRAALAYLRRRRRRLLLINTGVYNSTAATTGPQLLDISNTPVSS